MLDHWLFFLLLFFFTFFMADSMFYICKCPFYFKQLCYFLCFFFAHLYHYKPQFYIVSIVLPNFIVITFCVNLLMICYTIFFFAVYFQLHFCYHCLHYLRLLNVYHQRCIFIFFHIFIPPPHFVVGGYNGFALSPPSVRRSVRPSVSIIVSAL